MQNKWTLVIVFAVAGFLRFYNLGYSDYQGDEIKALYQPKEVSSARFFLDQRKGPMQFLVTAAFKYGSNDYRDRGLVRLPFALAGFGSVVVFYFLAKSLFNANVALYSTLFFTTNGLLIAFSRIVQYQSLVIFFGLVAIYLSKRYVDTFRARYLVVALTSLAVSILAHYDGIFFTPVILGLLVTAYTKNRIVLKHVLFSIIPFAVLTGAFYVPFVLNLSQSTADYWAGRISGDVSSKISSSRYLFAVYGPVYVLGIYGVLGFVGLVLLGGFKKAHLSVLIWFLLPFVLLEGVISIPGTHIYTYLIPTVLAMGFALYHIELLGQKVIKGCAAVFTGIVWLLLIFLTVQSYYIFVDHKLEYPWENKKFLIWTLSKPSTAYHLSLFGFPYHRYWTEVSDFIKVDAKYSVYSTNERTTISDYYVKLGADSKDLGYYIYVYRPQNLSDGDGGKNKANHNGANLVRAFKDRDRVVSEIYSPPLR